MNWQIAGNENAIKSFSFKTLQSSQVFLANKTQITITLKAKSYLIFLKQLTSPLSRRESLHWSSS